MSVVFPINQDDRFQSYTLTAGQTLVSVPFPFQDNRDVRLVRISLAGSSTPLTEPSDYTMTGAGAPSGGSATLVVPGAAGEKIEVYGLAVLDRVVSIVRNGKFSSDAIDFDLDRNRLIQQEQARDIGRAFKAPFGSAGGEWLAETVGAPLTLNGDGDVISGEYVGGVVATDFMAGVNANADDANEAVDLIILPATANALAKAATPLAGRTALGVGAVGETVFTAANKNAALSALGAIRAVNTMADLAGLTSADVAVGSRVAVPSQGSVFEAVASGGDLDYSGTGGLRLTIIGNTYHPDYLKDLDGGYEMGAGTGNATRNAARFVKTQAKADGRRILVPYGESYTEPFSLTAGTTYMVGDGKGDGSVLNLVGGSTDIGINQNPGGAVFSEQTTFKDLELRIAQDMKAALKIRSSKINCENLKVSVANGSGAKFTTAAVITDSAINVNQQRFSNCEIRTQGAPGGPCGLLIERGANYVISGGHISGFDRGVVIGNTDIVTSITLQGGLLIEVFGYINADDARGILALRYAALNINGVRFQIGNNAGVEKPLQRCITFGNASLGMPTAPGDILSTAAIWQRGSVIEGCSMTGHAQSTALIEYDGTGTVEAWLATQISGNTFDGINGHPVKLSSGALPVIVDLGSSFRGTTFQGLKDPALPAATANLPIGTGRYHTLTQSGAFSVTAANSGIPNQIHHEADVRFTDANTTLVLTSGTSGSFRNVTGVAGNVTPIAGQVVRFIKPAGGAVTHVRF